MYNKSRFTAGRAAVDPQVCDQSGVASAFIKWVTLLFLGVPMLQGCEDEALEEFFEKSQAIVEDRVNFYASLDDVLYAWDVRIEGGINIPMCHITMRSSNGGPLWSGYSDVDGAWSFVGTLEPGEQTLFFRVHSGLGPGVDFKYDVVVRDNDSPSCNILSPVEGVYTLGEPIHFQSENADPDGDPLLHLWSSDLEGGLIEGEEWSMALSTPGTHQIRVAAEDSFGARCSDTVSIEVQ